MRKALESDLSSQFQWYQHLYSVWAGLLTLDNAELTPISKSSVLHLIPTHPSAFIYQFYLVTEAPVWLLYLLNQHYPCLLLGVCPGGILVRRHIHMLKRGEPHNSSTTKNDISGYLLLKKKSLMLGGWYKALYLTGIIIH